MSSLNTTRVIRSSTDLKLIETLLLPVNIHHTATRDKKLRDRHSTAHLANARLAHRPLKLVYCVGHVATSLCEIQPSSHRCPTLSLCPALQRPRWATRTVSKLLHIRGERYEISLLEKYHRDLGCCCKFPHRAECNFCRTGIDQ